MKKLGLLSVLLLGACSTNKSITVNKPITEKIPGNQNVAVTVTALGPNEKYIHEFRKAFLDSTETNRIFKEFANHDKPTAKDTLHLKLSIINMDEPKKALLVMNMGGEAEVTVDAIVVDLKKNTELGSFRVKGNSKSSNVSVGGIRVNGYEGMENRAYTAASEQILEYLKQNRL